MNKFETVEEIIKSRTNKHNHKSSTGYKGVSIAGKTGQLCRYQARLVITKNRIEKPISISLGYYETAEEAYIARCKFIDSLK